MVSFKSQTRPEDSRCTPSYIPSTLKMSYFKIVICMYWNPLVFFVSFTFSHKLHSTMVARSNERNLFRDLFLLSAPPSLQYLVIATSHSQYLVAHSVPKTVQSCKALQQLTMAQSHPKEDVTQQQVKVNINVNTNKTTIIPHVSLPRRTIRQVVRIGCIAIVQSRVSSSLFLDLRACPRRLVGCTATATTTTTTTAASTWCNTTGSRPCRVGTAGGQRIIVITTGGTLHFGAYPQH